MLSRSSLKNMPVVRHIYESGVLAPFSSSRLGRYRGRFRTSQEARQAVPGTRCSSYDCDAMVTVGLESLSRVQTLDYPVLFFLQKLSMENRLQVVTDFGGHIGVKFYAFRELLQFPPSLRWQVVDVPAMLRAGKRRIPPGTTSLEFFERMEDTAACDVLVCSGVLQYADLTPEQIISRMPGKPQSILLNKVPVSSKGEGFVTLEYSGAAVLPYRVFTLEELEQVRFHHGYRLASSWTIPERDFSAVSSSGFERVRMIGQSWTSTTENGI